MEITDRLISAGTIGHVAPYKTSFSPDGKKLTYLFPGPTGEMQLYSVDATAVAAAASSGSAVNPRVVLGAPNKPVTLSHEEQLRRERQRMFAKGISSYQWAAITNPDGSVKRQFVVVPLGDQLILHDDEAADGIEASRVVYNGSSGTALDPQLSPNGEAVAFVLNNDLYVHPINADEDASTTEPTKLTNEGHLPGRSAGVADYVAQEEMSRYRGFWWSPDSTSIVYTANDESHIPSFEILHAGKPSPTATEQHRYPFAGKANPRVELKVQRVNRSENGVFEAVDTPVTVNLVVDPTDSRFLVHINEDGDVVTNTSESKEIEYYVARVDWSPDGFLIVQIENRTQTVLQVLRVNPATGESRVLFEETTDVWINLHYMLKFLPPTAVSTVVSNSNGSITSEDGDFFFLWASERTSFMQLYLYKYTASTGVATPVWEQPIGGGGEFLIDSIVSIDNVRGEVYVMSNYVNCRESHLGRLSLTDPATPMKVITTDAGYHNAVVSTELGLLGDVVSSVTLPTTFFASSFNVESGEVLSRVEITSGLNDPRVKSMDANGVFSLPAPVFHTIKSTDGKVDLECCLYLPPGVSLDAYLEASTKGEESNLARYPVIMNVYGGPHVQRVANNWMTTVDLRSQRFAANNIVVIRCDNRGSSRRGLAFEGAIKHDMGNLEVEDQAAAVNYFAKIGLVHPTNAGMVGWSYGGYMSAMSLCRRPDVFGVTVAGAPVTSWDGYDTHYTERYMGLPKENVVGYTQSSVFEWVHQLTGSLLLIHGLIDENVHFRHSARLINALVQHQKRYSLAVLPCERHGPQDLQAKIYVEMIILDHFLKNLPSAVTAAQ